MTSKEEVPFGSLGWPGLDFRRLLINILILLEADHLEASAGQAWISSLFLIDILIENRPSAVAAAAAEGLGAPINYSTPPGPSSPSHGLPLKRCSRMYRFSAVLPGKS